MKLLAKIKKLLEPKEKPRRPEYMWEILNIILPPDKKRRWRSPYPPLGDMRVDEVFNLARTAQAKRG